MAMTDLAIGVKYLERLTSGFVVLIFFLGSFIVGSSEMSQEFSKPIAGLIDYFLSRSEVQRSDAVSFLPFRDMHLTVPNLVLPKIFVEPESTAFPFNSTEGNVSTVAVDNTAGLRREFQRLEYTLDGTDDDGGLAVPRLIVSSLPSDLPDLDDVDLRKTVFFQVMLPLILQVNEMVLGQRHRLMALRDRIAAGKILTPSERQWLDELKDYYAVDSDDLTALLKRVDIVPPSLALAQAAIESGWGTSRFAAEGNAPFGQYTTDEKNGLRPVALIEGDMRIRAFGGLLEAVLSYMRNLNTHFAYSGFRDLRAHERAKGDSLDSYVLASKLMRYSVRGDGYVRDVRRTIRANRLDAFDDARLSSGKITRIVLNDT